MSALVLSDSNLNPNGPNEAAFRLSCGALAGAHETIAHFKPRLAIATEHKPDDEYTIPAAVRKIRADYQMECGPCLEAKGHVRPDVLYFW